jgi:predicted Zn-dependent peptidase
VPHDVRMEDFSPTVTLIDGVPVVSAPLEPVATATLIFTVGARDATARTAGIPHLVEHVVMRRVGRVSAPHNAVTDADSIQFFVSGSDAEIVDFLARVAEAIAWLPQCTEDDVAPERRTIGAELGANGEEVAIGPLVIRYGLVDLGVVDFGQPTYRTLSVGAVHDFARRFLHRGNAAVTITGAVPNGLRLPLPEGTRRPARDIPPTIREDLPGWATSYAAPLALNLELRGSQAQAIVTGACLEAFLYRALREELGIVYSVHSHGFGLDDELVNLSLALDPDPDSIPAALETAVRGLQAIASSGPDPEDLRHVRDGLASTTDHHAARIEWLSVVATGEARGRRDDVPTYADAAAQLQAVTSDDVQNVVAEALASLLVTVGIPDLPPDLPHALGLRMLEAERRFVPENINRSFPASSGRSFGLLAPRLRRGLRGFRVFASEHVIAEIAPDGAVFEAPLADVVAVARRADGAVTLATSTGRFFYIQPADWKDPRGWLARALSTIPAEAFYDRAD